MTAYVALLRGIMPMNPNMHGAKLKAAFEKMGFKNVRTVIASGNVIFTSPEKDAAALARTIETALPKLLGFSSTAIIRSQKEIEQLLKKNPFEGPHGKQNYLLVTFLKRPARAKLPPKGIGYRVFAASSREMYVAIDTTVSGSPNFMLLAEKAFGKEITSRTWNTVEKIAKKMAS